MYRILTIGIVLLCWKSSKVTCTICDNKPCGSGGTCTPLLTSPGYECTCFSGFLSPNCADRNECSMASGIYNNGSCVNTPGSYHCACFKDFTGTHCNNVMDACGSSPCKNGGTRSVTSDGGHVCSCIVGFNSSTDCDDIDECNIVSGSNSCNNGSCVNTQGSFSCSCYSGYQGKFCREDVDECLSKSCRPKTICVNFPGSYLCKCTAGYTGSHCQMDLDQCASSPCRDGSCVITNGFLNVTAIMDLTGLSAKMISHSACLVYVCMAAVKIGQAILYASAITDGTACIAMMTSTSAHSHLSAPMESAKTQKGRTRVSVTTVTMETHVKITLTNVTLVIVETVRV